ncbi:hypothetical protein [Clostridium botulinum]|uniref:hypothetical protein n=1 Tax=Clostridium botulinum TaxID=1491 RepID=UPI0007748798|nr:hypothetical protein [Clostridium botulinum]
MTREKVIIFGASQLGKIAFNVLKDRFHIKYFTDNDYKKWGNKFLDLDIIEPSKLIYYKNFKIIIASMYYGEISYQLKNMGLHNVFIFSYSDPNDIIYKKKFFLDKMCNTDIYKNIVINDKFKKKFLNNFSCLYNSMDNLNKKNILYFNNTRKKVLIIAYAFPPLGGSGIQRTLKFVKHLRNFNYEPIVVTVDDAFCNLEKDESFLQEIDEDIQIIRIKEKYYNTEQLDEQAIKQIFNLIYGLIDNEDLINQFKDHIEREDFIQRKELICPDSQIIWANEVLKKIESFIDFTKIDLIYSTGDPYSDHIIGFYLSKKFNKPWVADFRDEWTNNPHRKYDVDSIKYKIHFNMEKKIVSSCDKLITVTPISTNNYKKVFSLADNKVITITNGYDEDDFKNINKDFKKLKSIFKVIYNGTIYKGGEPYTFIKALNELVNEGKINCKQIKLFFIGKIDNNILREIKKIDKYNLVNIEGYKNHRESLGYVLNADLLLLLVGKGEKFKTVYTGKVFEYIRTYKPIISLAPNKGVVYDLLKKTGCGKNCEIDDIKEIKKHIFDYYINWHNETDLNNINKLEIKKYERQVLTKNLAEVFDKLMKS